MCLPSPGKLIDKVIKPGTFLGHITAPLAHPLEKKGYMFNAWDDMRKHMKPEEEPVTVSLSPAQRKAMVPAPAPMAPLGTPARRFSLPVIRANSESMPDSAPSTGLNY